MESAGSKKKFTMATRATDANGNNFEAGKITEFNPIRLNVNEVEDTCDLQITWNDPSGTENLNYSLIVFDSTKPVSAPIQSGKSATISDVENGTEFSVKITANNSSGIYSITIIDDVVKHSDT